MPERRAGPLYFFLVHGADGASLRGPAFAKSMKARTDDRGKPRWRHLHKTYCAD